MGSRAQLRGGEQRAAVEGLGSAGRRRVGPVRQWQDRSQGGAGAIRAEEQYIDHACEQSDNNFN